MQLMHRHAPSLHSSIHDVVIAGAGPVGLFLACELRRAGHSVLVLERADDPHSPLKRPPFGIRGLSPATLDAFDRRGLLDAMRAAQRANDGAQKIAAVAHWTQQPRQPAGHFAGIPFFRDDVDPSAWPYRLSDARDEGLALDMETLESVLAREAETLGVAILRGISVDDVVQSEGDLVTIHAGGEPFKDRFTARFQARWLVGCDGGRSAVRKAAGFDFIGTDPEFTGYSVDVELADPDALRPGRHLTPGGMFTYARPGTIAMADFDGGACHRQTPLTLEHVQRVLRRVSGVDVTLTALRLASTWTDRARQAGTYRRGRVLLAGDAAHIHSPLGGQGLNLGLGDAMNLGWKLSATLRGDAPDALLDTYEQERHPVGARVLDWSRAQVALMRPTQNTYSTCSTRALAAIVRDLAGTRDGATYFAERVWGVTLRYDLGDDHPLVGRSAPDFAFADGTTLAMRLRDPRGVLIDFDGDASLRTLAEAWQSRVTYFAGDANERLGLSALLVRPDGVVAWARDAGAPHADPAHALSRWFGKPVITANTDSAR